MRFMRAISRHAPKRLVHGLTSPYGGRTYTFADAGAFTGWRAAKNGRAKKK